MFVWVQYNEEKKNGHFSGFFKYVPLVSLVLSEKQKNLHKRSLKEQAALNDLLSSQILHSTFHGSSRGTTKEPPGFKV